MRDEADIKLLAFIDIYCNSDANELHTIRSLSVLQSK